MPGAVKAETEKRIRGAFDIYEKKNGKKKFAVVLASALAFAALFITVIIIANSIGSKQPDAPPETQTGPFEETDEAFDPPVEDGYILFYSLYENDLNYEPFRVAARLMKPCGDSIVVADDLRPLYEFFGENKPSAETLCDTFFAFYDRKNIIYQRSITKYSEQKYTDISDGFRIRSELPEGYYPDELILLSEKHGTFEYILTASVITDNTPGRLPYKGVKLYDQNLSQIGVYRDGLYEISVSALKNISVCVYKIRSEMGLPVIYARYEVKPDELTQARGDDDMGLHTAAAEGGSVAVSGRFSIDDRILELKNGENSVFMPVFTDAGMNMDSSVSTKRSSLCEYPYSFQIYDDNGLCGRKTVCDIINMLDLQWFFPMYTAKTGEGTLIIGDGIKTGATVLSSFDQASSHLYPVIREENEDNKYTTYFDLSWFAIDSYVFDFKNLEKGVSIAYLPSTCDRPYFDFSYFESDHPSIALIVKDGEIRLTDSCVLPGSLNQTLKSYFTPEEEFDDLKFVTTYPYIKDPSNEYGPSRPFMREYLPLLSTDLTGTPDLFEDLGLYIAPFERLKSGFSDLSVGNRYIRVTDVKEDGVFYGGEKNTDKIKWYTVYAYEEQTCGEQNGYIIDASGCVSGLRRNGSVYLFNTLQPCFEIRIKAADNNVVYAYHGTDNYTDNTPLHKSEETYAGLMGGTAALLLYKYGVAAPVYDIAVEDHVSDDEYNIGVDVAILPQKPVYGVKNNGGYRYYYYKNLAKTVNDGRYSYAYTDYEEWKYLSSDALNSYGKPDGWWLKDNGCERFIIKYRSGAAEIIYSGKGPVIFYAQ